MRVDFYHLQKATLDQIVPVLAERVIASGKKLLIKTSVPAQESHLDSLLWTYKADAWLPHGINGEGFESDQPILITSRDENVNKAEVILLTDGGSIDEIKDFERCLNIFDGNDETAVTAAREFWKQVVAQGFEAYYWAQNEVGKWEMKASKVPSQSTEK